ncbi:NAD(P)-dependent oxidoreductase [Helicobacter sp. CLO-3]|uniref:SDR family NAD(P)-dependent oxidoreductase n=1 Tax=unclassified Helicobacter TaxID=2593540 RepID=UPI00080566A7|nr:MULTISPECIES: SDR family NAD(P)-dependent oxidoreductase [unclassified Helicobacter]OBV28776.1 NAD(P)-dependent oxidoreductase [Helicobacter sp. CLO-3]OHU85846.1 NAD(P)-dependent oxidoreductase [Helicobacter sp. CLO-3]
MVVLITGASAGFGRACAQKFVANGDKVIATARRKEELESLQSELGEQNLAIIAHDITDIEGLKPKLDSTLKARGWDIDVLVNNAGLALGLAPAQECDINDWERMIEVNVLALVRLTHFVLPSMVARKKGHIINIGSIAGSYPYPGSTVYGATKAFVKQFSLNLRADLYSKNIRVSDIEPGLAGGSEFSLVRFKGDKAKADSVYEGATPLTPQDIAEAVCWVAHLPMHVNINRLEMMPTCQAPTALNVYKG